MPKQPTISIITVCFNAEKTIRNTLLSVLLQDYCNYEYIIVDGASKDNTVQVIKDTICYYKHVKVTLLSEPDKGIFDAMNKAIKLAKGEYVNFMNAGDSFYNKSSLKMIAQKFHGVDYVVGVAKVSDNYWIPVKKNTKSYRILCGHSVNHQASFIKRILFKDDEYDLRFRLIADDLFFIKKHILEGCSYQPIMMVVCNYDDKGVSSDIKNAEEINAERLLFLKENNMYEEGMDYHYYRSFKERVHEKVRYYVLRFIFSFASD